MLLSYLPRLLLFTSFILPVFGQTWQYRFAGNGATDRKGRLEIKIGSGPWGTICKDGFDANDAVVACRSLGIDGGSTFIPNSEPLYGAVPGGRPILRTAFGCLGNEQMLSNCISAGDTSGCSHNEDVGLECTGVKNVPTTTVAPDFATLAPITCQNNHESIRLVGGSSAAEGRVEIKYENEWGTICDDFWDQIDAQIVCKMLCNSYINAQAILRSQFPLAPDTTKILLNGVQCNGSEAQIDRCPHWGWRNTTKCTHKSDAGVICAPPGTLPVDPIQPTITCTQDSIVARIDKQKYPQVNQNLVDLINKGSNCNLVKTEDANFITLTIPYVGCNTVKAYTATHIVYKNTLLSSIPASTSGITRDSQYTVGVSCEILREQTDNTKLDPVMIQAPPVTSNTNFTTKIFAFNPATNQELPLPHKVTLGGYVGVGIMLMNTDPGLRLVLPDCFAAPSQVVTASTKKYPLIQDRCRSDSSVSIRAINESATGFTFRVFMFMEGTNVNQNLYLHCTGLVCGQSENSAQCDRTCNNRKKRSIMTDTSTSEHVREKRSADEPGITVVESVEGPFIIEIAEGTKTVVKNGMMWADDASSKQESTEPGDKKNKDKDKTEPETQRKASDPLKRTSEACKVRILLSSMVTVAIATLIMLHF